MFDLRYHVASLAAVFFALVVGILVGVALASHGLGDKERETLQRALTKAQDRADQSERDVTALQDENAGNGAFVKSAYSTVMAGRLQGQRVAVVFVGPVDRAILSAVNSTLTDTGARLVRTRAVKVPVDTAALAKPLRRRPFLAAYAGKRQIEALGHALGQEFAVGGDTPLWNALDAIVLETRGDPRPRADGVIVVRTVPPQTREDTALFLRGLYSGVGDAGVPVVGVGSTRDSGLSMKTFQRFGLSTVDDVDTPVGKLALAILLGDPSVTGDYGTKPTADDQVPNVTLAPVTTTTGG